MATQSTIVQQLSKALHVRFHAIPQESLPQRWVELIHHLNEQERKQSVPHDVDINRRPGTTPK